MPSNNFKPNWVSNPGDTILDFLKERNLSTEDIALKLGKSKSFVNELISGSIQINQDIAQSLSLTIGSSPKFWLSRQNDFQVSKIALKESEEQEWVKQVPYKDMVKLGWISDTTDKLNSLLNFFGVSDIFEWREKYEKVIQLSAFRTSKTYESDPVSVASWLRRGEIVASTIDCKPWNTNTFEDVLESVRPLTRKKRPSEFLPELISKCAEAGVAIAIVKTPIGCRASGATMFLTEEKAVLLLSFRYLSDDQFWFTFYHEAGHLILHEQTLFIEVGIEDSKKITQEEEANIFAGEMLIPHQMHSELSRLRGNKRDIINFSIKAGVSPGIVVGQMQHLGFIDKKYLNAFKRHFDWDEISQEL